MGQLRIFSIEAIILRRHKLQVLVWTSSLTQGIIMYYFSPKVFGGGGLSCIIVLICWLINCNLHLGNPLIIYCWITDAFRLMKHLLVVTSTSTSTFKLSIWAHIQQCPVPFKTVLKDTLWILFWNCPLGKLERSGKLCFQSQYYYYHVAPVQQRLRVPVGFLQHDNSSTGTGNITYHFKDWGYPLDFSHFHLA